MNEQIKLHAPGGIVWMYGSDSDQSRRGGDHGRWSLDTWK